MKLYENDLPRVNKILHHPDYIKYIGEIEELEKDRIFCRHNMEHFISVARIAWILNLKENRGLDREMIYAAALLHDIGRGQEYLTGVRHEEESARLAPPIIESAGFDVSEKEAIISAIATHRDGDFALSHPAGLNAMIYRADKLSRPCYRCMASDKCTKAVEKRNVNLII